MHCNGRHSDTRGFASIFVLTLRKQFPGLANCSENALRDDIISDTMNGIHSSKMGELWLLISKFRNAQLEVEMTKMWKKCVIIQEESRGKTTDVCNIIGLPNGPRRRILTEDLTLRQITTKFLPACLRTTRNNPHFSVETSRSLQ
jgi:hypothetical protein